MISKTLFQSLFLTLAASSILIGSEPCVPVAKDVAPPVIPDLPIPIDEPTDEDDDGCYYFDSFKCKEVMVSVACLSDCHNEWIDGLNGPELVPVCTSGVEDAFLLANDDAEFIASTSELPVMTEGFRGRTHLGKVHCGSRGSCECEFVQEFNQHFCGVPDGGWEPVKYDTYFPIEGAETCIIWGYDEDF